VRSAVATVLVALLSACGAGFDATSTQTYAPSDGIQADSGDIRVLNALVVAREAGSDGAVSATVVNRGDRRDRLTGATSPDGTVELSGTGDLPAGGSLTFGTGGDATATLRGLARNPGETITLELMFARAAPVRLDTVVLAATGDYAELAPAPATSPPSP